MLSTHDVAVACVGVQLHGVQLLSAVPGRPPVASPVVFVSGLLQFRVCGVFIITCMSFNIFKLGFDGFPFCYSFSFLFCFS